MKNKFGEHDCVELINNIEIGLPIQESRDTISAAIVVFAGTKGMIGGELMYGHMYPVIIASTTYLVHQDNLVLYRKSFWPDSEQDPHPAKVKK